MKNITEIELLEKELAAFKKNNEELIHRNNAAISSWDEERERALREADRVEEWKRKYEELEEYIRFIGKQIPCNTGGTFENDPIDAILDAAVRALNAERLKKKYGDEANERTLESLRYNVERTKVFEEVASMLHNAGHDQRDAAKKIYEIVREKYPIGTYCPDAQKNKIYENKL
jgi:uncharacterized membrane-anchored protein YjiN (DUF445 family)